MRIVHEAGRPIELPQGWDDRWEGPDDGLIATYVRGTEIGADNASLRASALAGELPVLPWAGGLASRIKSKTKMGSLHYLAMWQGIRGESLNIETSEQTKLTCTKFGITVTFTGDITLLQSSTTEVGNNE